MYDPFENNSKRNVQDETNVENFKLPDFNTSWMPPFEEGIKTKVGRGIEKGTDIIKKTSNLYIYGLLLIILIIILPAILRLVYEFSSWAFDLAGKVFP